MDRQLLLAKKEVTYGTDAAAVAANTVLAEEVQFRLLDTRVQPNPAKPGVGPVASHVYGQHAELGFKIPLAGSGDAGVAPKWGPIMKACGWNETVVADTSVTYALMENPIGADSMTLVWRDGNRRLHKVLGWRGRVGLELTAGQRPMLVINGRGLHVPVATAAAELAHADASFAGWNDAKPVASGTTQFTFDGISGLGLRALSFEQSDNVKFTDVPEQENVELVGARRFTGQQRITCPLASTINFENKWVAGDVVTWAMTHGSVAGLIATINGRTQVLAPEYSRDDDHDVLGCGLELVPSSLTTDDDLSIVLT
ncbi:MAG: hypothetical protein ACK41C_10465 [Phenylobacterium sp.]|uniref:hypothetical protein n=1 Tax=Phenylobacterium sp. TaxID=1871053 RepID=UPI00391BF8D0